MLLSGGPEVRLSLDEHLRCEGRREPVVQPPPSGYTRRGRMRRRPQQQHQQQQQQHRGGPTTEAVRSEPQVVRIGLLGGYRLWVGPRVIEEDRWRLRKARSLIKLLAFSRGHRLHREQVMELLWPGLDPHSAVNNLHYTLHIARRAFEPSAQTTTSSTTSEASSSHPSSSYPSSSYLHLDEAQLTLSPDAPVWVDVEAFEEAAATAHHAMEPAAFRAAIDLYAGELLPEDRY